MIDVSVLTPSFGYGRFIKDGVISVLKQEGLDLEHIVQDGGSGDETLSVLAAFGDAVKVVSEPDAGQSDALNKALKRATGRWVSWLNADEFYLPGALMSLIEEGERSGADVVYGERVDVDESGRLLKLFAQYPFSRTTLRLYGPYIASCAVILRRSSLPLDPWDPELRLVMDWDLYLKMHQRGSRFAFAQRPIGAFRIHADQESAHHKSMEPVTVRIRYGIPPRGRRYRRLGRLIHFGNKIRSGAYGRQKRAEALAGKDLRWFLDDVGRAAFDDLLMLSYGTE